MMPATSTGITTRASLSYTCCDLTHVPTHLCAQGGTQSFLTVLGSGSPLRSGRNDEFVSSEPPGAEIGDGLADLLGPVHHEGAVAGHGLAQGPSRDDEEPRRLALGRDFDAVAGAEHGELAAGDGLGRLPGADARAALEDIGEGRVVAGQGLGEAGDR